MGIEAGYKTQVGISTNGTTYVNGCFKTTSVDETVDLSDITTFCDATTDLTATLSAARRKLAELFDTAITLDGDYDGSTEMKTTLRPGTSVYIRVGIDTDGDGTVDEWVINVPMIAANRSRTFNVEEKTTISVPLEGNGPPKYGVETYV